MQAAVYKSPKYVETDEVEIPEISEGEALIRVHYSGLCGSDLFVYSGHHPRATTPLIMGHEFSGEIVELNPEKETAFAVGDRVTVRPTYYCGECYPCSQGDFHVCESLKLIGIDTDGGFAEYVKVPLDQIYKVPAGLDSRLAALTEPLAVAIHGVRMSNLKVGDIAVIQGAGPIGILLGIVARLAGAAEVYITDINGFRLEKAAGMGLNPINVNEIDPVEYIAEVTAGRMADITFDAAGVEATAKTMTSLTRIRGQIMVVGVFKKTPHFDLLTVNFKEQQLLGTRVYTDQDFTRALKILVENKFIGELITDIINLDDLNEGLAKIARGSDVLKVLVDLTN